MLVVKVCMMDALLELMLRTQFQDITLLFIHLF